MLIYGFTCKRRNGKMCMIRIRAIARTMNNRKVLAAVLPKKYTSKRQTFPQISVVAARVPCIFGLFFWCVCVCVCFVPCLVSPMYTICHRHLHFMRMRQVHKAVCSCETLYEPHTNIMRIFHSTHKNW